jgi:hypothetical protein
LLFYFINQNNHKGILLLSQIKISSLTTNTSFLDLFFHQISNSIFFQFLNNIIISVLDLKNTSKLYLSLTLNKFETTNVSLKFQLKSDTSNNEDEKILSKFVLVK